MAALTSSCQYTLSDFKNKENSGNIPELESLVIEKINKLYDEGHEITYWTARSTVHVEKREEYTELTRNQLDSWGCKYHNLRVGDKPHYDLLVCDKSKRIEEL